MSPCASYEKSAEEKQKPESEVAAEPPNRQKPLTLEVQAAEAAVEEEKRGAKAAAKKTA